MGTGLAESVTLDMMQRLQKLALPLRILVYAAAAVAVLGMAAVVGATTALMLAPDENPSGGAKSQPVGEANPEQAGQQGSAPERQSEAEYLDAVGDLQNGAVEVSIQSNGKLLRYDSLNSDDIEDMKANYAALENYRDRAEALDPPEKYEGQYEVFVLAISELYAANKLAYRMAADPVSAAEDDFDAYDRHIDEATSHLRRSNEILGRDYKTTEAAQDVSLG
jgi:hypothetical protein